MRVLLDTNVLVSAILFGGLPRELLRRALRGDFAVVTSAHLMREFEEVLRDRFGVAAAVAQAARAEYELLATLVQPEALPRIVRDADDDQVLAAAAAGYCDALVTGDRDLLSLGSHDDMPIITPRQFEEQLAGSP